MKKRTCYGCGGDLTAGTLKGKWETRRHEGQAVPVIRFMDMTGCPVEECKSCGIYLWGEDADEWYVRAYRKLFSDLISKKELANDW